MVYWEHRWEVILIEKQYTIGAFAALNKITARMLRHYDKIGLLKPAAILENGYRAYTSAQIETVSRIRRYQNCGFSLSEIMPLLHTQEDALRQAAKTKLAAVGEQDRAQQLARLQLLSLAGEDVTSPTNHYDISYVQQSERTLLCCEMAVGEAAIEAAMDQLCDMLVAHDIPPDGAYLLCSDLEAADRYRVAVPVARPLAWEGYECITLPAGWYLSTLHYGDYYNIGMAYDRLLCFAEEQGHALRPPFWECYLVDAASAASPAQYLTQILIRLTP